MAMLFKKPEPTPNNGDNGNGKPVKSKWQYVIDHMDAAHKHMGAAMDALSMINFDLQKGADFIARYRESLIKTITEAGGEIEQQSIEQEIKEFLPRALRERTDEEAAN